MIHQTHRMFVSLVVLVLGVGCASAQSDDTDKQQSNLKGVPKANASYYGGKDGKSLSVSWLQWQDNSCEDPRNNDGSPWGGKPEGASCKWDSDCALSCNACPESDAHYLARACWGGKCVSAQEAGEFAFAHGAKLCR